MRLRNSKIVGNTMHEVGTDSEAEEVGIEMMEDLSKLEGEEVDMSEERMDIGFQQMLSLIKEMNRKFTKEIGSMREESNKRFEKIEKGIKDSEVKWERDFRIIQTSLISNKREIHEKVIKEVEDLRRKGEKGDGEDIRGGMEQRARNQENEKNIAMLWEEIDNGRIRWNNLVKELKEDITKGLMDMDESVGMRIQQEISRVGACTTRKEVVGEKEEVARKISSPGVVGEDKGWTRNQEVVDTSEIKELSLPKFEDKPEENPKRFIAEFEEFARIRKFNDEVKMMWFKKCLGTMVRSWYDAIGSTANNFSAVKECFLQRYWSSERQMEVIRKIYMPGDYANANMTREQYLIQVVNDNKFLDNPLTERSLILAVSRQFGDIMAQQVIMSDVSSVEKFAKMLSGWESIEKDRENQRRFNRDEQWKEASDHQQANRWRDNNWRNNRRWKQEGWHADNRGLGQGRTEDRLQARDGGSNRRDEGPEQLRNKPQERNQDQTRDRRGLNVREAQV